MHQRALQVLLVEDDADDAQLVRHALQAVPGQVRGCTVATTLAEALKHIAEAKARWDVILLDLMLPDSQGRETFLRVHTAASQVPVVVLSGVEDDATAVAMVAEGAQDYLCKTALDPALLVRSLRYAVERARARGELREMEERYALVATAGTGGIWDWNLRTGKMYFSPRWKVLLGYEDHEIGSDPEDWLGRIHADDVARVREEIQAHLDGRTPQLITECRVAHKDGSYRWMSVRGLAARDHSGAPVRLAGSQSDVTGHKLAEDQLRQGAFFDTLTGLPNRVVLLDRLGRSIERSKRRGDYLFALLFLDIDGFKVINDSLGHAVGDEMLVGATVRFQSAVRSVDTVARLGGDEFAIILDDIRDTSDALRVATRIQKLLSDPFTLAKRDVVVSASIGIALSSHGYVRPEEMLRDADTAMYRAKAKGKACHEIFDKTMHVQAVTRLTLEGELRRAIEGNEMRVHYQPIISLRTGRITGFEALVRWQHPERGLVPPAQFIPVAEETGLIVAIDRWVLREACRQMHAWHQQRTDIPPLSISVNLSRKQLHQPDLVDQIRETLKVTGLTPSALRPEITESEIMEDIDAATTILTQLKDMNVLLHMDDFGTGYSSLSYLVRFRVDTLKIDGSFVSNMEAGGENVEIVRMIIALAHNLGMQVIAEGVETEAQYRQLKHLKCEFAQGYFMSRPVDADAAAALLASEPKW